MFYAIYEDLVRDVALGGAARLSSAVEMAETHAGEKLRWKKDKQTSLQTARSSAGIIYHVFLGGSYDRSRRFAAPPR